MRWLRAFLCLAILSCGGRPLSPAPGENKFFGYFENRFFLLEHRDVAWRDFNTKFQIGDYNRLRLMGKFTPDEKVVLNVAVDFFTFHGIVRSPFGSNAGSQAETPETSARIDLDRAYMDLRLKGIDISLGKQRVALGVSYLWAPLDIFNRINIFEPKEEKPGTTAVKLYVPIRGKTSLTGVFAPESGFAASRSALRGQTQLGNVDIGLTLIRWGVKETTVFGLDLRGENLVGWWLEGGLFSTPVGEDYKVVIGLDYTFPVRTGLYWLNEFFYDSSGEKDPARYDVQKMLSGERFTLGRVYLLSMLRFSFSEFLAASVAGIINLGDGSYILNPVASYDLSQSLNIAAGLYVPLGPAAGEFSGRRQNVFFVWVKLNF